MGNQITSQVLGQLTQDEQFSGWWRIEQVAIPLFDNKQRPVCFMAFEPNEDKEFISTQFNNKFQNTTVR